MNWKLNTIDKMKIDEIEKKCEKSLDEILKSANEAAEISKKTEEELQQQTEQIKHINKETENIEENLKQSEQHLLGIKYWWKNINALFGFDYNEIEKKEILKEKENNEKSYIKQKDNLYDKKNKNLNEIDYKNYKENLGLKKENRKDSSFKEKYERDLNSLSVMLDELHSRALAMGNTINEQNKILNEVNEKMESNIEKIIDQQKLMKEIMKK